MLKKLRFLTVNPLGGTPGWAKREEERLLARIRANTAAVRVNAERDEEVMRERHRNSKA